MEESLIELSSFRLLSISFCIANICELCCNVSSRALVGLKLVTFTLCLVRDEGLIVDQTLILVTGLPIEFLSHCNMPWVD